MFHKPFFKEFAIRCRDGVESILNKARAAGFDLGPELNSFAWPDGKKFAEGLLVAVTEKRTKADIDRLVDALK